MGQIIISSKEEIELYRSSPDANQSNFKLLSVSRKHYLDTIKRRAEEGLNDIKDELKIGLAVDDILTGDLGSFGNNYYVSTLEKEPSDSIKNIVLSIFEAEEYYPNLEDERLNEEILSLAKSSNYGQSWKPETIIKKIREEGAEYYNNLLNGKGKIILTKEQENKINTVVMSLSLNERTKDYFDREKISLNPNLDVYYQLPVYFNVDGIDCKALLDIVMVEFKDDLYHITPIDLKTTYVETTNFKYQFKKLSYQIQASFYFKGIKSWAEDKFGADNIFMNDFQFIVESTTNPGTPVVYTCDNSIYEVGEFGLPALQQAVKQNTSETIINIPISKEVRGFRSLLKEYEYYQTNGWETDKVLIDNPETIPLSW